MTYYGDLECPICRDFTLGGGFAPLVANEVRAGKVKVVYKAFETATKDPNVFKIQQVAALAAGQQQRFWNFTELFYHEQGAEGTGYVGESYLAGLAKQIPGLNLSKWQSDRSSSTLATQHHHRRAGRGQDRRPGHADADHGRTQGKRRARQRLGAGLRGSPGGLQEGGVTATAERGASAEITPARRSDRRLSIAILVPSLIGIGVAGYLTYVHYEGLKVLCLSSGGCETVQASRYAKLDGVPVAVLGLLGYIGILGSLAAARRVRPRRRLRDRPDRLRLQHVPHLPRAVHDQGDLPVVRVQRGDHDRAGGPHRDPRGALRAGPDLTRIPASGDRPRAVRPAPMITP